MEAMNALEPIQQAALKAVWSHLPTIYVYALAYACACRISLRTWLAVSALPPAPMDLAKEKSEWRRRVLCATALVTVLLGTEFGLLYYGNEDTLDRFLSVALGGLVFSEVSWSISSSAIFNRLFQWRMVRSPRGFAAGRLDRSDATLKKKRVLACLATASIAGACTFGAVAGRGCTTLTMVTVWGVLTAIGARPAGRSMSIRGVIILLACFQAVIFFLPIAIVAFAMSSEGQATVAAINSSFGTPSDEDSSNLKINSIAAMICPAIYAGINAYLITICYRFDYFLHLQRNPDEARPSPEVAIAADGTTSVAITTYNPRWFPKRYFSVAFFFTLVSHLAAPGIVAYLPGVDELIHAEPSVKTICYGVLGMFIATPLASVGVIALALARREGKDMWKYREEWFKRETVGTIKLEAIEAVEAGTDEKKALLIIEEDSS